jgi:predicted ferric reductase
MRMNEQIWWYTARSSGIVALVLVTMAVVWGLLFSTRLLQGRPSPKWLLALHRHLGGLSVIFTAVHVAALVADSYIEFGPSEILVPLASTWKPQPVAWGIVAMYLMAAVELTSLLQKHLPRRLWRWTHVSSYALFWMSIVHGLTAGTDATTQAYRFGSQAAVLLVVFLTVYRVLTKRKVKRKARPVRSAQASPRLRVAERVAAADNEIRGAALSDSTGRGLPEEIAAAPRSSG